MSLTTIASVCSSISAILAFGALLIKPVREKLLNNGTTQEGIKCLLRQAMLDIYYDCVDVREIRQYKYQNFCHLYNAYKALGGNSFIDHIKDEVDSYKVIT